MQTQFGMKREFVEMDLAVCKAVQPSLMMDPKNNARIIKAYADWRASLEAQWAEYAPVKEQA